MDVKKFMRPGSFLKKASAFLAAMRGSMRRGKGFQFMLLAACLALLALLFLASIPRHGGKPGLPVFFRSQGYWQISRLLGPVRIVPFSGPLLLSPAAESPEAVFSPFEADRDLNRLAPQNSSPY